MNQSNVYYKEKLTMANYEGNRIRCSKTTANHLITSKGDGYYKPIDFRKALDLEPGP